MTNQSPVYRGDDPGFQTQAVGNYPAKSDVADQDNIYLSDQGWVYRHFKSLDKSKYWDEVIWAGDVTNPPVGNDPVDPFGDADPDFLTGDGIQSVSGVYPGADPTIGTSEIQGAASVDTAAAIPYKVSVSGTLANGNTYAWSVDGPGTAVISNASGTFTGNTDAQADTNITFPTEGTYTITCLIKSSATASTGSVANFGVTAAATVADTIGDVTISGQTTPDTGLTPVEYSITYTGTAPESDITFALAATPNNGVNIETTDDPNVFNILFADVTDGVATTLTATLTDDDASDSPKSSTLLVTPATP